MTRPPWAGVAGAAAVVAVVLVGDLTAPARVGSRAAAGAESAAVTDVTLACPDVGGNRQYVTTRFTAASSSGSGRVVTRTLGRGRDTPLLKSAGTLVSRDVQQAGVGLAVYAEGSIAAGLEAEQTTFIERGPARSFSNARCVRPGHTFWFVGLSGAVDVHDSIYLMNPDDTPASVDLSLWGAKGPIDAPHLQGLAVPAHARVVVPVDRLAPDAPMLGLRVVATSGRIAAVARDQRQHGTRPDGNDWVPGTLAPATRLVLPGYPTGLGARTVFLTNPGSDDANVTLRVVTDSGSFVPTGFNAKPLPAGTTARFELHTLIENNVAAVVVTSDQPVVATGHISRVQGAFYPDRAWTAATPPLAAGALVTDVRTGEASSVLLLSAPEAAGTVTVQALGSGRRAVVRVPAGRTVSYSPDRLLPSGSGALLVTPGTGSGPVYAARVLAQQGAHGPLLAVLPLLDVPGTVTLPPARYDPGAALQR